MTRQTESESTFEGRSTAGSRYSRRSTFGSFSENKGSSGKLVVLLVVCVIAIVVFYFATKKDSPSASAGTGKNDQESGAVTTPDPCNTLDCGQFGTCVDGKCACTAGYSGQTCEVGPSQPDPPPEDPTDPNVPPVSQCGNLNCGSHGSCVAGACECTGSWSGDECDKALDGTDELVGWGAVEDGGVDTTTGGGTATPETVSSLDDLRRLAAGNTPRVIIISGTISGDSAGAVVIGSHKTIMGADSSSQINGGFSISNQRNVIVRNLKILGTLASGKKPNNCIAVQYSHHIWLDHLELWDAPDGNLALTDESGYITVSWCKFRYTSAKSQGKCASVGSTSDRDAADMGKLRTTFHHNWFAENCYSRMPYMLYGQGHVFDNYYTATDSMYCIGVGAYASVAVENNYFLNSKSPHWFVDTKKPAYISATGNVYDKTSGEKSTGEVEVAQLTAVTAWSPATKYKYTQIMHDSKDVPAVVMKYAGAL